MQSLMSVQTTWLYWFWLRWLRIGSQRVVIGCSRVLGEDQSIVSIPISCNLSLTKGDMPRQNTIFRASILARYRECAHTLISSHPYPQMEPHINRTLASDPRIPNIGARTSPA